MLFNVQDSAAFWHEALAIPFTFAEFQVTGMHTCTPCWKLHAVYADSRLTLVAFTATGASPEHIEPIHHAAVSQRPLAHVSWPPAHLHSLVGRAKNKKIWKSSRALMLLDPRNFKETYYAPFPLLTQLLEVLMKCVTCFGQNTTWIKHYSTLCTPSRQRWKGSSVSFAYANETLLTPPPS